tara:strand:- start:137 stop:961 length:825 start_codon:yes stop_codon:yes gene_type:complete
MIDFLYANGCSWTFGNGIEQDLKYASLPVDQRWEKLQLDAWPSLLSSTLGVPLKNDSIGAASNARMVRKTVEFLQNYTGNYENLVVILGWTSVDRDELYLDHDGRSGWVMFNTTQPVSSHGDFWTHGINAHFLKQVDQWQKHYIMDIYQNYERYHNYFQQLYLMKNLLENLKIKYIFFKAMNDMFSSDIKQLESSQVSMQFAQVQSKIKSPALFMTRDDLPEHCNTMEAFCRTNGYPMCADNHTQTLGHWHWSQHLANALHDLYKVEYVPKNNT